MSAAQRKSYLPDAVGLATLMAMVAIMSAFVSSSSIPGPLWIAIYLAWAAGALFVWHKVEAGWKRWPLAVICSIGGAVLWYVAARAIGNLAFGDGEPELSKIVDLVIALIMSPGLTFIAVAGWARELMRGKQAASSPP